MYDVFYRSIGEKSRAKARYCIKSYFGLGFFSRKVDSVNRRLEQRIERNEGSRKTMFAKRFANKGKEGQFFHIVIKERG